jgi:hypothetical protein
MFFGWFSFGDGTMRRGGGGCLVLPFLFLFGSCFMFDNFNPTWLLLLLAVGVGWYVLRGYMRGAQPVEGEWDGEKPKRDFGDEKPKRVSEVLSRDDGDVIEVIDPPDTRPDPDRPQTP